jgi:hypothetical protein
MAAYPQRNRIVNFRVTEGEYDRLRRACGLHGWRTLSDFARSASLTAAANGASNTWLVDNDFSSLSRKMADLSARLHDVLQVLHLGTGAEVRVSPSSLAADRDPDGSPV